VILTAIGIPLSRAITCSSLSESPGSSGLAASAASNAVIRIPLASYSKNLDLERLKAAIRTQLDRLIEVNETRVDLREQFESLIEEYNSGSSQIDPLPAGPWTSFFQRLKPADALARKLLPTTRRGVLKVAL